MLLFYLPGCLSFLLSFFSCLVSASETIQTSSKIHSVPISSKDKTLDGILYYDTESSFMTNSHAGCSTDILIYFELPVSVVYSDTIEFSLPEEMETSSSTECFLDDRFDKFLSDEETSCELVSTNLFRVKVLSKIYSGTSLKIVFSELTNPSTSMTTSPLAISIYRKSHLDSSSKYYSFTEKIAGNPNFARFDIFPLPSDKLGVSFSSVTSKIIHEDANLTFSLSFPYDLEVDSETRIAIKIKGGVSLSGKQKVDCPELGDDLYALGHLGWFGMFYIQGLDEGTIEKNSEVTLTLLDLENSGGSQWIELVEFAVLKIHSSKFLLYGNISNIYQLTPPELESFEVVSVSNSFEGVSGVEYAFKATPTHYVPENGKIVLKFPETFSETLDCQFSRDGSGYASSTNTFSFILNEDLPTNTNNDIKITCYGVTNPNEPGDTGDFTIEVYLSSDDTESISEKITKGSWEILNAQETRVITNSWVSFVVYSDQTYSRYDNIREETRIQIKFELVQDFVLGERIEIEIGYDLEDDNSVSLEINREFISGAYLKENCIFWANDQQNYAKFSKLRLRIFGIEGYGVAGEPVGFQVSIYNESLSYTQATEEADLELSFSLKEDIFSDWASMETTQKYLGVFSNASFVWGNLIDYPSTLRDEELRVFLLFSFDDDHFEDYLGANHFYKKIECEIIGIGDGYSCELEGTHDIKVSGVGSMQKGRMYAYFKGLKNPEEQLGVPVVLQVQDEEGNVLQSTNFRTPGYIQNSFYSDYSFQEYSDYPFWSFGLRERDEGFESSRKTGENSEYNFTFKASFMPPTESYRHLFFEFRFNLELQFEESFEVKVYANGDEWISRNFYYDEESGSIVVKNFNPPWENQDTLTFCFENIRNPEFVQPDGFAQVLVYDPFEEVLVRFHEFSLTSSLVFRENSIGAFEIEAEFKEVNKAGEYYLEVSFNQELSKDGNSRISLYFDENCYSEDKFELLPDKNCIQDYEGLEIFSDAWGVICERGTRSVYNSTLETTKTWRFLDLKNILQTNPKATFTIENLKNPSEASCYFSDGTSIPFFIETYDQIEGSFYAKETSELIFIDFTDDSGISLEIKSISLFQHGPLSPNTLDLTFSVSHSVEGYETNYPHDLYFVFSDAFSKSLGPKASSSLLCSLSSLEKIDQPCSASENVLMLPLLESLAAKESHVLTVSGIQNPLKRFKNSEFEIFAEIRDQEDYLTASSVSKSFKMESSVTTQEFFTSVSYLKWFNFLEEGTWEFKMSLHLNISSEALFFVSMLSDMPDYFDDQISCFIACDNLIETSPFENNTFNEVDCSTSTEGMRTSPSFSWLRVNFDEGISFYSGAQVQECFLRLQSILNPEKFSSKAKIKIEIYDFQDGVLVLQQNSSVSFTPNQGFSSGGDLLVALKGVEVDSAIELDRSNIYLEFSLYNKGSMRLVDLNSKQLVLSIPSGLNLYPGEVYACEIESVAFDCVVSSDSEFVFDISSSASFTKFSELSFKIEGVQNPDQSTFGSQFSLEVRETSYGGTELERVFGRTNAQGYTMDVPTFESKGESLSVSPNYLTVCPGFKKKVTMEFKFPILFEFFYTVEIVSEITLDNMEKMIAEGSVGVGEESTEFMVGVSAQYSTQPSDRVIRAEISTSGFDSQYYELPEDVVFKVVSDAFLYEEYGEYYSPLSLSQAAVNFSSIGMSGAITLSLDGYPDEKIAIRVESSDPSAPVYLDYEIVEKDSEGNLYFTSDSNYIQFRVKSKFINGDSESIDLSSLYYTFSIDSGPCGVSAQSKLQVTTYTLEEEEESYFDYITSGGLSVVMDYRYIYNVQFTYSMDEEGILYYRVTSNQNLVYENPEDILSTITVDDEPLISGSLAFGRSTGVYDDIYDTYNGVVTLRGIENEETSYFWFVALYETGKFSEIVKYEEDSFFNIETLDFSVVFEKDGTADYVPAFANIINSFYSYSNSNLYPTHLGFPHCLAFLE